MLPSFRLARPKSLAAALAAIGEDRVPYCGGTELLLAMRAGLHRPETLVDIKGVPELAGVRLDRGELVIGSSERHDDLASHPLIREQLPMLARVEGAVGNARVRAQGSIGGNLCFAEPKSDVACALTAYAATVTLASPTGRRTLAVEDFIAGPYFADKQDDELMIGIRIPLPSRRTQAVYLKYQITERPTVGVALLHDPVRQTCRLSVGAVGEELLCRTFDHPAGIDPAEIADEVDPTADLTGFRRITNGM